MKESKTNCLHVEKHKTDQNFTIGLNWKLKFINTMYTTKYNKGIDNLLCLYGMSPKI